MRTTMSLALLALLAAACATPEVAEDYQEKAYVPEELAAALGGEEPARRADAARQVEGMEEGRRLAVLLELLKDERAPVRLLAVGLLGRHHVGDPDAIAGLAEVLVLDADVDVRTTAVAALEKSRTRESAAALLSALSDDPTLDVRCAAGAALDRMTGRAFGAELTETYDTAEMAADDAAISYEDWYDKNSQTLPRAGDGAAGGGR